MSEETTMQAADPNGPEAVLVRLPLIPLVLTGWCAGKSLRPFLVEALGLSASRLRLGASLQLRDSTERRAIAYSRKRFQERATALGWDERQVAARLANLPSVLAGEPRPYADLIYHLEHPGCWGLPLTIALAEEIDKLVAVLLAAHANADLQLFKQALLENDWGDGFLRPIVDREETARRKNALHAANDWEGALTAAVGYFEDILWCLPAALDAEFGSAYFGRFQPRPLFLCVTPQMHNDFDLDVLDKRPLRNLVSRPIRRLLELSHALIVWSKEQRWPDKPVGRSKLGEVLQLDDQSIGNLFDGTKKMTAKLFDGQWTQLNSSVARGGEFAPPMPLLLAAVCCQNGLLAQYPNQRLKSVVLIDEAKYTRFWGWHRQRWSSQLRQGTESWPAWLGDQP
jgi:hypothetical protein